MHKGFPVAKRNPSSWIREWGGAILKRLNLDLLFTKNNRKKDRIFSFDYYSWSIRKNTSPHITVEKWCVLKEHLLVKVQWFLWKAFTEYLLITWYDTIENYFADINLHCLWRQVTLLQIEKAQCMVLFLKESMTQLNLEILNKFSV